MQFLSYAPGSAEKEHVFAKNVTNRHVYLINIHAFALLIQTTFLSEFP
jgi:hypothetical protein